ncbi:YqgE/AlgH family protein [Pleomorphovibrio marinus]|uniref:YqgE/AlgH family protein n=1 Tax=Pleomorphovibrio marinus TaxID=2164132 RepID=UPI000E0BC2E3|nr:YqgE/AlgH family protein [Pleomorphovibrio marinus]
MKENNNIPPHAGSLLISEPFLQDENFVRSVILLCDTNEKGSFGLVLNKLSIFKLGELLEGFEFLNSEIYVGGPVEQNTLHFIYFGDRMLEGSIELTPQLWWGGNFEELLSKLRNGTAELDNFKFFIGYSGWSEGQLEEEIATKTWIVCNNIYTKKIFYSEPEELWREILKNMGGEFQVLANYPIDPRLN